MKQMIESIQLPADLESRVAHFAELEGISAEQWILTAIAGKLELAEFLDSRVKASGGGNFTDFLRSVPSVPPEPGDELPEGWTYPRTSE